MFGGDGMLTEGTVLASCAVELSAVCVLCIWMSLGLGLHLGKLPMPGRRRKSGLPLAQCEYHTNTHKPSR